MAVNTLGYIPTLDDISDSVNKVSTITCTAGAANTSGTAKDGTPFVAAAGAGGAGSTAGDGAAVTVRAGAGGVGSVAGGNGGSAIVLGGAGAAVGGLGGSIRLQPGTATAGAGLVLHRLFETLPTVISTNLAFVLSVSQVLRKYVQFSGAAPTPTLPTATDLAAAIPDLAIGDSFDIMFHAANGTTVAAGAGMTIIGAGPMVISGVISVVARFIYTATNTFVIFPLHSA